MSTPGREGAIPPDDAIRVLSNSLLGHTKNAPVRTEIFHNKALGFQFTIP